MKKIIVVVGPTASGKTNLSLKLAKKIRSEIISADSRAIYRNLDIGSARVPGKWKTIKDKKVFQYKSIPHHLIDFLSPKKSFSAFDFAKKASAAAQHINVPIVVGGTGFWIDAFLGKTKLAEVGPDRKLRMKLSRKTLVQLLALLKKHNPTRYKTIQKTNKRRVIRALEIALQKKTKKKNSQPQSPTYDPLFIGITLPNKTLKKNIKKRFLNDIKRGLVKETKKLSSLVNGKRLKEIGLMYPIVREFIAGKISKEEMIDRSVNSIYHYAKRQKTWFKKNPEIIWVRSYKQAESLVKKFLNA